VCKGQHVCDTLFSFPPPADFEFLNFEAAKFRPEKYDFDPYKGFSMAQISQISKEKISGSPDSQYKFQ
jgi:hypothetical protein